MARKKVATGKKKSIGWYLAHDWQLWVMLLPAIIYIFIFCYVPMYGVQLAFREYDFKSGIYGGKWVGFKYFKQFFDSAMFGTTLRNTFVTAALSIVLGFPAPIVLAMIINQIRQQKWKENCSDNGLYSILYFNGCYGFYLKYYVSKQGWRNQ